MPATFPVGVVGAVVVVVLLVVFSPAELFFVLALVWCRRTPRKIEFC